MVTSERPEPRDRPTEPGDVSQPSGDGPVTVVDRTSGGAPGANQGKAEPMSPTPDHPEPRAVPTLAEMNVGAGDPQAPSHPSALARADDAVPPAIEAGTDGQGDAATSPSSAGGPADGTSQTQARVDGVRAPQD